MLKTYGRKNERINLSRVAGVSFFEDQRHNCPIHDISLTGMLITSRLKYPIGTSCSITLDEQWSGQMFTMSFTGKVARHSQDGIAIQFSEMALKPYALLQTVLLYGCNNPLVQDQEFTTAYPLPLSEHRKEMRNC